MLLPRRLVFTIVFLGYAARLSHAKADSVRICVPGNVQQKNSQAVKSCEQLARSKKSHATCVFGVDRYDCLKQVDERKADMTVLEAEDLLFTPSICTGDCSFLVVSEVRAIKQKPYEYEAVVVVRKSAKVRPDLKGASLCHPGWTPQDGRSTLFSWFLEERLAPQSCGRNVTILEDRIRTTAGYFGPSCKPGAWSSSPEEDARLKKKYPSLCARCESPDSCSNRDKFWGPGGAVTCFKEDGGDVLWTTYSEVRIHFLNTLTAEEVSTSYELLCKDGTTQPLDSKTPCVWLARPWQVVIASAKMAAEVQKALDMLSDENSYDWEDNLISVFDAHKEYIVNLEVSKPAEDYLATVPGYMSATEQTSTNCNPPYVVTMCTTSIREQNKCAWLARAAQAFGVAPSLHCMQLNSLEKCAKSVADMEADYVVVPADFQPIATLQYNLQPILYEDFKAAGAGYSLAAVVRQGSEIGGLRDLKQQRACFGRHDGLAWRAVLMVLREHGYVSSSCSATNVLHGFFSQVCSTAGDGLPLCCGKNETSDQDTAALQCLISNGCDVAFISNATLQRNIDGSPRTYAQDLRVVCADSEKDGECSWAWAAPSAVMAAASLPAVRLQETHEIFSELSRLFIRRNKAKSLAFAMFGPFFSDRNVIFQDNSWDLTPASRFMDQRPSYHSMQHIFNLTKYCSTASAPSHSQAFLVLVCVYWFFR